MLTVQVPFHLKNKARELGLTFDNVKHIWSAPDDFDIQTLLAEDTAVQESKAEAEETNTAIAPELATLPGQVDWSAVIASDDTLRAAMAIRDYGLPMAEEERVDLLQLIAKRRQGIDYCVTYDALCSCSDIFVQTYPIEYVTRLVQENVRSVRSYSEEIRSSMRLTNEQKARLLFVLPV